MEKEKKLKKRSRPSLAKDLERMHRHTRRQILARGDSIYVPFRRTPRIYVTDRYASRTPGIQSRKRKFQ